MSLSPPSHHSDLSQYPRPSVAVDVAVLTAHRLELKALVVDHRLGGKALPGTFLHAGERLADAATRALRTKAGLSGVEFAQLRVFDELDRDDRGWVLSVAHSAAVPARNLPENAQLTPVEGLFGDPLLFDHGRMVELAVEDLRHRYAKTLDPGRLLEDTFTVLELRTLYQAVYGHELMKDTFRRQVIEALEPTGRTATASGRPAELFRRRAGVQLPASAYGFFSVPRR